jgi:hypothetical protein
MSISDDTILPAKECARICGASPKRIYWWVETGRLKQHILTPGSGQVFVRLGDVRHLLRTAPRKPIAC